jgi:hypothetical protein
MAPPIGGCPGSPQSPPPEGTPPKLVIEPFRKLSKQDSSAIVEEGLRLFSFAVGEGDQNVLLIPVAS